MGVVLRRKLLWLIAVRAAAVTVLMGSLILVQTSSTAPSGFNPYFVLVGLTYALTALYAATLRLVDRHRWLVDLQLGCDALIVSATVFLTGGVVSYFSFLYALPIVASAILQFRRGGLMVGAASALMYTGLVLAQYTGALEPVWPRPPVLPEARVAAFTVALNLGGFVGVAVLTGYLAEGLRRADARLQTTSSQLADLRAFSQHVIDSLTSGLMAVDPGGLVLTFNRAAEHITGLTAAEAVGRAVGEVLQLPPGYRLGGETGDAVSRQRLDVTYVRPGGRTIDLGLGSAPLVTPTGQVGSLITFQDVTESRRIEREMRVQQRLAAVGEMAAGIAHEIRNPLASMSGSLQMLRQELPLSLEQAQLMDIVLRESERLNETIRGFLTYARPQRLSTTRLDLCRLVNEAAALLRNSAEFGEGHDIRVDVSDGAVWYEADEGQIRQIVWNLATNGLRAMPEGGRLTLAVSADSGSEVLFRVTDDGVGMPQEELDRLFQPFRSSFARGTGLGLAIVHRIVSDYGGEVRVMSQPAAGTTVTVRLPVPLACAVV